MPTLLKTIDTGKKPGALLAAVATPEMSEADFEASFGELTRLCETLGYTVHGRVSQKKENYHSPTVFGLGKLKEIAHEIFALGGGVNAIIFDRELSPLQGRNVENAVNAELAILEADYTIHVYDRTAVIIEIFYKHAKSRQSKLQIEIAKLKYGSPRLREELERNGDRQGGGVGGKGAGETKSELRGRELRDRIAQVKAELEILQGENEDRRANREAQSVALVGYTNSGKSSLMRKLTESDVYAADRLFATLDVTTRQLQPPVIPPILVADTIGFVRFLPHDLLASFKSTLAEASHADLLLHIVDGSDPQFREQIKTTQEVLKELKIETETKKLIFNKIDKIKTEEQKAITKEFPEAWFTSAFIPEELETLRSKIREHFKAQQKKVSVEIAYAQGSITGAIRKIATIEAETFNPEGTKIEIRIKPNDLARLKNQHPALKFKEEKE